MALKRHQKILKCIRLMLGDDRISMVNIMVKEPFLAFDVEFCQRHICRVEIDNKFSEIPRAVFWIYLNHPVRKVENLQYTLHLTCLKKPATAWMGGVVAPKRCFETVRIPWDVAKEVLGSNHVKVIHDNRDAYVSDWEYSDYFTFELQDDDLDPLIDDDDDDDDDTQAEESK